MGRDGKGEGKRMKGEGKGKGGEGRGRRGGKGRYLGMWGRGKREEGRYGDVCMCVCVCVCVCGWVCVGGGCVYVGVCGGGELIAQNHSFITRND